MPETIAMNWVKSRSLIGRSIREILRDWGCKASPALTSASGKATCAGNIMKKNNISKGMYNYISDSILATCLDVGGLSGFQIIWETENWKLYCLHVKAVIPVHCSLLVWLGSRTLPGGYSQPCESQAGHVLGLKAWLYSALDVLYPLVYGQWRFDHTCWIWK